MSSRKAVSTRISTGRPVGAPAGLTVVSFCPVYSASEPRSCAERVRGEVEASQDYGAGRGRDRRTSTPIPTASAVQQAAKELSKSGRQRHASNAALTVLVRRFLTSARWRRSTRLPNAPQNQRRQTWPRRPSRRAARIGAERSARGDPRRRGCAALVRAPSRANACPRPQPRQRWSAPAAARCRAPYRSRVDTGRERDRRTETHVGASRSVPQRSAHIRAR